MKEKMKLLKFWDFFNYAKILYAEGNIEAAIQFLEKSREIEEVIGQNPKNIEEIDELLNFYTKR